MTLASNGIQIDAPPEKVWAVLSDLSTVQDYSPGVSKAYYTSEERNGIGASRHCDLQGPSGWVEERVAEWDEGRTMTIEIYDSNGPLKEAFGRFDLTPDGHGTIVAFTFTYEMKFGPLGVLMDAFFARPRFDEAVQSTALGLKHHIETGQVVTDEILAELRAAA
jgi:carbon monoxide dehydrogenase subunit G